MMKANEFRLGNLVKCPEGFGQVTQIQDREVLVVDEIGYIMEEIKPIPLTEEWLLKFGFEKIERDDCCWYTLLIPSKYDFNILWDKGDSANGMSIEDYPVKCKHVHQLQNLYFALTGEELKQ